MYYDNSFPKGFENTIRINVRQKNRKYVYLCSFVCLSLDLTFLSSHVSSSLSLSLQLCHIFKDNLTIYVPTM